MAMMRCDSNSWRAALALAVLISCGGNTESDEGGPSETGAGYPAESDTNSSSAGASATFVPPSGDGTELEAGLGLGGAGHCHQSESHWVAGEPTGEAWCEAGHYVHRPTGRVSCPHVDGNIGPTAQSDEDECVADSDCDELEICTTGSGRRICTPRCVTNADCTAAEVCACVGQHAAHTDGTFGTCVATGCKEDDDCPGDAHCAQVQTLDSVSLRGVPNWGVPTFHCQSPDDECSQSSGYCYWKGQHRAIFSPDDL